MGEGQRDNNDDLTQLVSTALRQALFPESIYSRILVNRLEPGKNQACKLLHRKLS